MHGHHAQGDHAHPHGRHDRAFAIGIALNMVFTAGEAAAGIAFGSLALLADAGHNLGDVLALALAWGATWAARRAPTARRTYGFGRATIIASMTSAALLCVALGAMVWEALGRLSQPEPANGAAIVAVAAIGMLVNGGTAVLFMAGRRADLNVRGAFLHMAGDAAVSGGVVLAGVAIAITGWTWLDPAVALAVGMVILASGVGLLRESLDLALDAVPRHVDTAELQRYFARLPGVTGVHDLHVWPLSTFDTALTVHLVVPGPRPDDAFLQGIGEALASRYAIRHPTIQIEDGTMAQACACSAQPSRHGH